MLMSMPRNFFAFCRGADQDSIRRIPLDADTQNALGVLFDDQEQQFLEGREEEVPFTGDWKPDDDQLLTITDEELAQPLVKTLHENVTVFDELDIKNFNKSGIKAIFTRSSKQENRILIQQFKSSQYLGPGKWNLIFDKNRFKQLSQPGFTLASNLAAVLDGSVFKFQSFQNLRIIFKVQHHFQEATHQEVRKFADHSSLCIDNHDEFMKLMTERIRKLIKSIIKSQILENYETDEIIQKARSVGIELKSKENKIIITNSKLEIKTVLSFLEDSVFRGSFSEETYETNSKRAVRREQ
ncbi:MAG: hypothetical protein TQ37_09340 [Candidatus Synechococcus spongiarum 15L]|uniref:DUF4868 domain-containing protein n=2 Tax=Candidatus Synechococcus spongiarum TaxID=431041 RepID=A0A1T1C958_9SYNE|nr:MAG: hypothetical protein TQ37_09340 [Candidatus Synechococcus spongiarum 15L]OOV24928.1 hypothetical protein BV61_07285 [Candidatus Synechococcus spongiarum LMB bulk15M]